MTTPELEKAAHAKFSASSSARWFACPGSIALSERAPPQRESPHALEGTQAHKVLEAFLKNGKKNARKSRDMLTKSNPMEMVQFALDAATEIWRRTPEGAQLISEAEVDFSFEGVDAWGTSDVIIIEDFGQLEVIDYKYGAGYPVEVENNPQLLCYAVGAARAHDYNFTTVKMTVIQPRADHHSGETTREWTITIDELQTWEAQLQLQIDQALDPFVKLYPGDHCRWCPCKPICPSIGDKALVQAGIDFAPVSGLPSTEVAEVPPIKSITNLGVVLEACELIEQWIDGVRSHALHVLESGGKIEGFKLVAKRGQRSWNDEEKVIVEAQKKFGDGVFTDPELLSPAQLEKKFKAKEWVAERIVKLSSGSTIAPESDPRPAINQLADDFGPELLPAPPEVKPFPEAISMASARTKRAAMQKKPKAKAKAKKRR